MSDTSVIVVDQPPISFIYTGIGIGLSLKGWVATVGDLPTDAVVGDTYMVQADGLGYVFGETGWSAGISLQGPQGDPGTDGREVEVQKSLTHVQWRYVGDATWTDLVALADIIGPQGETGATGDTGAKGDTGDAGPNTISSSTTVTGLSGVLKVSAGYAAGSATYSDVGAAAASHTHAASEIASGTIATARLGSGTADSSTYLRGDQTWASVSGGSATQAFGTVSVSGQSDVVADAAPDTLTLVAGSNITITTNASSDSITIAASGGGTTNLSVTNKTSTSLDVASDTGTDATLPAATADDAGLMTAAEHTKLAGVESAATAAGATGDAFAVSHLAAFDHANIAHGETAYGWGDHASVGYLTSVTAHDHASNKLAQSNTHESADTDSATTALHHTLGTGANQAAAGNHAHAQLHDAVTVSGSTTVDLSLSGQQVSASVITQMSITSDASGIKLSGDSASPGNSKLYGTDSSGAKGWYNQPTGEGFDIHATLVCAIALGAR